MDNKYNCVFGGEVTDEVLEALELAEESTWYDYFLFTLTIT